MLSEPSFAQKQEKKPLQSERKSTAATAVKLPVDFFSRDKIRVIRGQKDGSLTVLLYILLVCMAAKANRHGDLVLSDDIPCDDNIIASLAQMEQKQVQTALVELMKYGMIGLTGDVYSIINFDSMTVNNPKKRAKSGRPGKVPPEQERPGRA